MCEVCRVISFFMFDLPFFQNTKDDLHCVQAVLKSVLKYYFPQENYSFKKLDEITAHKKGKWTWKNAMIFFLASRGLEVVEIVDFDSQRFAEEGIFFLKENWPREVFEAQERYSDLRQEQLLTRKLLKQKRVKLEMRIPLLSDMRRLLKEGYILMTNINPCVINNQEGYWSHFVLIVDIGRDYVIYHDSGLPPEPNKKVSLKVFMKAMGYPKKNDAALYAVRKPAASIGGHLRRG